MDDFRTKPIPLKILKLLSANEKVLEASKKLDDKYESMMIAQEEEARSMAQFMDKTKHTENLSASSSISAQGHFSSPCCLIAEDSHSIAKALKRCVESRGWCVSVVDNGEDGLRLLKMRNWNCVLLDDQMPRLSGTNCIVQFREWEGHNRIARQKHVYLVSAYYAPTEYAMFPTAFDGAISKPVKMKHLLQVLDSIKEAGGSHSEILLR